MSYSDLVDYLRPLRSGVVAFSGGVDSTLLVLAAREAWGEGLIAVCATSLLMTPGEQRAARDFARDHGISLEEVSHPGAGLDEVENNRETRCYACKSALFSRLRTLADERGVSCVLCGDNADDASASRPGALAASEQGVMAPLAALGLSKEDVRSCLREAGIDDASLISSACLATRFPPSTPLDEHELVRVGATEDALRSFLPTSLLRVRVDSFLHARIELDEKSLSSLTPQLASRIIDICRERGYTEIRIDDSAYRPAL